LLSADGETFVFAMCHLDSSMTSTTDVTLYRRKSDGTRDVLEDAGALGLSSDGQRLLIYDSSAVAVVNADGTRTVVPIPEAFATDVRITGDGVSVFGGVTNGGAGRTLARWTESGGLETLGDFPQLTDAVTWEIGAVNQDGTVVVGYAQDADGPAPFRWTAAGGLEDLGSLPEGVIGARPTGVSADGTTVTGFAIRNEQWTGSDIFRWTAQDQLQIMGASLPIASWPDAGTLLLSTDGAVLAGAALLNGAPGLVRWGEGGTAVASAGLAFVSDMTPDGSVLVGSTAGTGFLWRPPVVELTTPSSAYDVTRVETLLEQSGADATGWALESITNISDDGRIIYGTGTCGGVSTYYRMQLSP
jgi:probable HAF family extracellular repeat protein